MIKKIFFAILLFTLSTNPAFSIDPDEITFELFIPNGDSFFNDIWALDTLEFQTLHPNEFYSQTQQNWCWAAVSSTVIDLLSGTRATPCELASMALGRNCCRSPSSCNQTNTIDVMTRLIESYGAHAQVIAGTVDWRALKDNIDDGDPVTIGVRSDLGAGHVINVVGYEIIRNTELEETRIYFHIHDPMYGYFKGTPSSMGYSINYWNLLYGELEHYQLEWDVTILYEPN